MNDIWSEVSEKLNDKVDRADEVIEPLLNEDLNDIEISHWWNFLSKLSGIPRDELIKNAIEIKESKDDKEKKEIEYCELLKIEKSHSYHFHDPLVRCQISSIFKIKIPEKSPRTPWIFRWIYSTDSDKVVDASKKNPGNTLSYIKYIERKGEIKFDRLFKRASFTTKVRNGTPEKWSPDCLPAD